MLNYPFVPLSLFGNNELTVTKTNLIYLMRWLFRHLIKGNNRYFLFNVFLYYTNYSILSIPSILVVHFWWAFLLLSNIFEPSCDLAWLSLPIAYFPSLQSSCKMFSFFLLSFVGQLVKKNNVPDKILAPTIFSSS